MNIITQNAEAGLVGRIMVGKVNKISLNPSANTSETTYLLESDRSIHISGITLYQDNLTSQAQYVRLSPFDQFAISFPTSEGNAIAAVLAQQATCQSTSSLSDCTCEGKVADQFPGISLVNWQNGTKQSIVVYPNRYMAKVQHQSQHAAK